MYGMTREEAANKALAYDKLVSEIKQIHSYMLSIMSAGDVAEIMRPVERLLDRANRDI